jgi:small conductance mechanosensitive channel
MQHTLSTITRTLPSTTLWAEKIAGNLLLAIIIFIVSLVIVRIGTRVIRHSMKLRITMTDRRRDTLASLLTHILKYTVYFIMVLTILPLFGINIAALLAGAGVAGLAIGFGAQSLVTDFFSGFFILFEDQYGIGDWVVINNVTGKIVLVGPRITAIQVWTGEIVYFRNGTISAVTNYSKSPSLAVITFNVGYDTHADTALAILKNVLEEVQQEDPHVMGDIQILGVNMLNDSNYTIEATIKCEPYSQYSVQRLTYKKLQKHFLDRGMKPPFQSIVMVNSDNQPPKP